LLDSLDVLKKEADNAKAESSKNEKKIAKLESQLEMSHNNEVAILKHNKMLEDKLNSQTYDLIEAKMSSDKIAM